VGQKSAAHDRAVMSVQFDSNCNRWVVRWYEAGRQRSRRFADQHAARAFDAKQRAAKTDTSLHMPKVSQSCASPASKARSWWLASPGAPDRSIASSISCKHC
jgi:hypothetical protein